MTLGEIDEIICQTQMRNWSNRQTRNASKSCSTSRSVFVWNKDWSHSTFGALFLSNDLEKQVNCHLFAAEWKQTNDRMRTIRTAYSLARSDSWTKIKFDSERSHFARFTGICVIDRLQRARMFVRCSKCHSLQNDAKIHLINALSRY